MTSSFAKEDRGNLTGVTGSSLIFGWIFMALISSALLTSACSRISGDGEDAMGVLLSATNRLQQIGLNWESESPLWTSNPGSPGKLRVGSFSIKVC